MCLRATSFAVDLGVRTKAKLPAHAWMSVFMKMSNAKAIVTGGVSGLGLAVSKRLVELGANIAVLDIHKHGYDIVKSVLRNSALFIDTNVASESSVQQAIKAVVRKLGSITLAVNCAGIAQTKRVIDRRGMLSQAEFTHVLNVNLIGTFNICQAAAYAMCANEPTRDGERGVIINTASIAAYEGQVGQTAYAASKGGVVSLTLPLAREFARFGIRVMAIAPGIFETPLIQNISDAAREHLIQSIPFPHRPGDPSEFAALVCSIYENHMLNGEVIRLDGALRMPMM
jgi:3-hydroxyacyl-CoA dehydrogenase/3-hydroxy-2-methylbutyryl-CoA dehydrogenase